MAGQVKFGVVKNPDGYRIWKREPGGKREIVSDVFSSMGDARKRMKDLQKPRAERMFGGK